MRTMVPQPYVNHVPTLTGSVGYDELHYFYTNHFFPAAGRCEARPGDSHDRAGPGGR
jgi:hypothetical protein